MSNVTSNGKKIRQTIIYAVEAPRLRGVWTKHFIEFRKARELYEKIIAEKNKEPGTSIPFTSYKESIEDTDLHLFVAAGWVETNYLEAITEFQIKQCIDDRCHRLLNGEHLHIIEESIKSIVIKMQILKPKTTFGDYIETNSPFYNHLVMRNYPLASLTFIFNIC